MAISQIIWSLDDKEELQPAELISESELEDLLAEHIEILNEDWLLIGRRCAHPLESILICSAWITMVISLLWSLKKI